jgi:hypothetical protein
MSSPYDDDNPDPAVVFKNLVNTSPKGCVGQPLFPGSPPLWPPQPTALETTLAQRGQEHGEFSEMANITQQLKDVMHNAEGTHWEALSADKKEALEMIVHKIARILCGNPEHKDHWHDIAGYATLSEDRTQVLTPARVATT